MKNTRMKYLLETSVIAGLLVSGMAVAAHAQDNGGKNAQKDQDKIVVTGSRIARANSVSVSPVTQIDASDIASTGTVRVEDMVNTLPQAFAGQGSAISNGATGTATVDLRGLGASRTLVLVNGRRLGYGGPDIIASDLNQIPSALVKRVEVLTGGASATYGSDAIAGVVNFIMDDNFQGAKFDAQYSVYQHSNSDRSIQSVVNDANAATPGQYNLPNGNVWDGGTTTLTGVIGGNFDNGKGNATVYASYIDTNPVLQANRDYSACALGASGDSFYCKGSATNNPANFLNFGLTGAGEFHTDLSSFVDGIGNADTFNYNPYNYFQRPDSRYMIGSYAHYHVNDHLEFYTELSYMDDHSIAQIAPSGVFGGGVYGANGGLNCDNPYLTAQQVQYVCTDAGYSGSDVNPNIYILRRNTEGNARQDDIRHQTLRGVFGIRGDLAGPFTYDVYASYYNVHYADIYRNEVSVKKSGNALYAVEDPNNPGNIVCHINVDNDPSNDDPSCVPYNIFSGTPSQAATDYISRSLLMDGTTTQQVVSGTTQGDLSQWGIKSPWANDGVSVVGGFDYRYNSLDLLPGEGYTSGDGFGQGGAPQPVAGNTDVFELFGETNIPLVQDAAWAQNLSFDGAYRYSSYGSGVNTNTYKAGLDWQVIPDIRLRGSYSRAVRAPNVVELFSAQSFNLFDLTAGSNGVHDPCAGANPSATAAQCANTGVTAAQYGHITDNPAGQFNQLTGGNPDLNPETADTYTVGAVFTPSYVPGLTLSVDYWDISVANLISTVDPGTAVDQCIASGDPTLCSLIHRGVGGTLWVNSTGYVTATNTNIGGLKTDGVDVLANYTFDIPSNRDLGSISMDFVGTYLDKLVTDNGLSAPYDCSGYYGGSCGTPNPTWRHRVTATWNTPWNWSTRLGWRYYGGVDSYAATAPINARLGTQNYFDLSFKYHPKDNVTLRAGVNNLMDKEPPLSSIVGAGSGNGNTFPQVYDSLGRYFFMGVSVDM